MTRASRYALCALAIVAVACDSDTPTTPTTEPTEVTETFTSIVQRNGTTTRSFSTEAQGLITVTLTSLGQDAAQVGLGLGLSDTVTGQCLPTFSVITSTYLGRAISVKADPGQYCIVVSDVGELTNQSSFAVDVRHF
jgi:hypothetical protein